MPSSFTDNQGTTWTLHLTHAKVLQLAKALGLDALNPQHHLAILDSLTQRLAFVALLCEDEAKKANIGPDEFEGRLYMVDGDPTNFSLEASRAFLEELADFFQRLGQTPMAKLTRKAIEVQSEALETTSALLENGTIDSLLEMSQIRLPTLDEWLEITGNGSTSSEQSLA